MSGASPASAKLRSMLVTYFVYRSLLDAKIQNAEVVSRKIRQAFTEFPNWKRSENALRELRKKVTFAIFAETDELDRVTAMVRLPALFDNR
jgi:type I restriction enzyme R subunit